MRALCPPDFHQGFAVTLDEPAPAGAAAKPNPLNDAIGAYALAMVAIIVFITLSVAALAVYLRWRSRHPLPQPESLEQFFEEHGGGESDDGEPCSDEAPPQGRDPREPWERPSDWWKKGDRPS